VRHVKLLLARLPGIRAKKGPPECGYLFIVPKQI